MAVLRLPTSFLVPSTLTNYRFSPQHRLQCPCLLYASMEPSRPPQPSPNPSSLLWAHQIRREHIHLVHQIDSLRADLAVATQAMEDLQQDLAEQAENIRQGNDRVQEDLHLLEGRLDLRLSAMLDRIQDLETENVLLGARLEGLELERQPQRERDAASTVSPRKKHAAQTISPGRQSTVLKIMCENGVFKRARTRDREPSELGMGATGSKPLLESEILAPDSMPAHESSPLTRLRPGEYVRSLSETTMSSSWGASSNPGATAIRVIETREKKRQLAAFFAEHDREYKPRENLEEGEEVLVRDFLRAIPDVSTRELLKERCRDVECQSWNGLRALVHEVIREIEDEARAGERAMQPGSGVERDTSEGDPAKRTLKRKREITIVPPDDDEQRVIDAYVNRDSPVSRDS